MKETYSVSQDGQTQGWAYTTYLHTFTKPMYMVNQIYVVPEHRGKGIATKILTDIVNHADWENATLILDFQPGEFNSDKVKLHLFYERFGFTWDASIGAMRREPR